MAVELDSRVNGGKKKKKKNGKKEKEKKNEREKGDFSDYENSRTGDLIYGLGRFRDDGE